ncbi:hypothetical protein AMTR_s00003p00271090 [Amborella trichopoda]|uniref:Uncharacterized protein n=1 Tax=Amborella trichopoda TaxID=13333 RepID=W1P7F5_AMBTC|nr:hypothetical protein AMTR_s00003p00271090 [Amborella trichopoda]
MGRILYAAGVRATQGVREQAPKWDVTYLKSWKPASRKADSGYSTKSGAFSNGDGGLERERANEAGRWREEERVERVMHLILWGPHKM